MEKWEKCNLGHIDVYPVALKLSQLQYGQLQFVLLWDEDTIRELFNFYDDVIEDVPIGHGVQTKLYWYVQYTKQQFSAPHNQTELDITNWAPADIDKFINDCCRK